MKFEKILFRKFSRKISEKFGGKLFYQRDQQPKVGHQEATRDQKRVSHAARFLGRVGPTNLAPRGSQVEGKCSSPSPRQKTSPRYFPKNFPSSFFLVFFDLQVQGRFSKSVWWDYSLVCDSSTHPITFCSYALYMKYFAALGVT